MKFIRSIRRTRLASAVADGVARVKRSSPSREVLVPESPAALEPIESRRDLPMLSRGRGLLADSGLFREARRYYSDNRGIVHTVGGALLLFAVAGFARRRRLI